MFAQHIRVIIESQVCAISTNDLSDGFIKKSFQKYVLSQNQWDIIATKRDLLLK